MSNSIVTKTVNYDFIFMGAVHCETLWYWWAKKKMHYSTSQVCSLVFLHLYQVTLADDTDSKIAENEQNSKTTKIFTKLFLEESQNNILDWLLTFLKMTGVAQKGGWLHCCFSNYMLTIVNFLYRIFRNYKHILFDSLFIQTQ